MAVASKNIDDAALPLIDPKSFAFATIEQWNGRVDLPPDDHRSAVRQSPEFDPAADEVCGYPPLQPRVGVLETPQPRTRPVEPQDSAHVGQLSFAHGVEPQPDERRIRAMPFDGEAMGVEKRIGKEDGRIGTVVRRTVGTFLHEAVTDQTVSRHTLEWPGGEPSARITSCVRHPQVCFERALEERRSETEETSFDRELRHTEDRLRLLQQCRDRFAFTRSHPTALLRFDRDGGQCQGDIGQRGVIAALPKVENHGPGLKARITDAQDPDAIDTRSWRHQHELPGTIRERPHPLVPGRIHEEQQCVCDRLCSHGPNQLAPKRLGRKGGPRETPEKEAVPEGDCDRQRVSMRNTEMPQLSGSSGGASFQSACECEPSERYRNTYEPTGSVITPSNTRFLSAPPAGSVWSYFISQTLSPLAFSIQP